MPDVYTLKLTRPGLDYVRQVLGTRPYDEVGPLIANLEQQRREQDEGAAPSASVQPLRAVEVAPETDQASATP
jgi:hypothetical protein